jgi:uncharacterized protein (UPF0276 family)
MPDGVPRDRFGLTWHPSLAGQILAHGHRLDILEVIPEGRFLDSRRARRALKTLSHAIPVAIHGVSLGLSSTRSPRRAGPITWRSCGAAA